MADKKLMVDTSLLIVYFRKTDKNNARLLAHFSNYNTLYISSITVFEVLNGTKPSHQVFLNGMISKFTVLDFDSEAARQAALITEQLKVKRKTIDKPDLFIAATAIANGLQFDTLNIKHFAHIEELFMLSSDY
jgi:predicted nucleic acid-binding protein